MSCTAAAFPGVTAFDRRFVARRDERRRVSHTVAVSVGTVTVTGAIAGTATLAAACIIGWALGGAPHMRAGAPLALRAPAASYSPVADAFDQLQPASDSAAQSQIANEAAKGPKLALLRAALDAAYGDRDVTASLPAAAASRWQTQRLADRGSTVPLPSPRPRMQVSHEPASTAARQAASQPEAAAPAHVASLFNLFDPEPMSGSALSYAPAAAEPVSNRPAERANEVAMLPPRGSDERHNPVQHQSAAAAAKPAEMQVASAGPTDSSAFNFFKRLLPQPSHNAPSWLPGGSDGRTAVYDIEAHTVYLPNGERLEAHSGLGNKLDDPRYIGDKARGPTPPNVYQLTERGELFHGVRALRLNPVEGSKMFGRDGILAHTYMLGPSGQSFGCVSFKDYEEFLKAYERGEINRLVVVPHLDNRASNGGRDGV
jgi:hypothetical protein